MSNFEQILLQKSPQPLHAELQHHWQNYRNNAERQNLAMISDPATLEVLAKVWAASDFIARHCSRDPNLCHELLNSGDLQRSYQASYYAVSLVQQLAEIESETDLGSSLRRFPHPRNDQNWLA